MKFKTILAVVLAAMLAISFCGPSQTAKTTELKAVATSTLELKGLKRPNNLIVGEKYVYVADYYNLFVFEKVTGDLVKKIGGKGNGPGKINPARGQEVGLIVTVGEKYITLESQSKVVLFDSKPPFKYVGEFKFRKITYFSTTAANNLFMIGVKVLREKRKVQLNLRMLPIKNLENPTSNYKISTETVNVFDIKKRPKRRSVPKFLPSLETCGSKVFWLDPKNGGRIGVYNAKTGEKSFIVFDKDNTVQFPKGYKQWLIDFFNQDPVFKEQTGSNGGAKKLLETRFAFTSKAPTLRSFRAKKGLIAAQTNRYENRQKTKFLIFDRHQKTFFSFCSVNPNGIPQTDTQNWDAAKTKKGAFQFFYLQENLETEEWTMVTETYL